MIQKCGVSCLVIHNDAFLAIADWRTIVKTFVIAFLWLTVVFL